MSHNTATTHAMETLNKDRRWLLLGYLDILEKSNPNGRIVHAVKQRIMHLRWLLKLEQDLNEETEQLIKELIKEING